MNADTSEHRPYVFVIGMLTGTLVGIGLAWIAPLIVSDRQRRVTDSAKGLTNRTGRQAPHARVAVAETTEDLARRSQAVRDNIAQAVAHRAREVEAYAAATTARSDRTAGAKKLSPSDPAASNSAQKDEPA